MNKYGLYIAIYLIVSLFLQGCMYPGKPDLVQNGNKMSLELRGSYKKITHCIVDATVNEEYKLGELQSPVNIFRPNDDERMIEIGYAVGVSSIYLWLAEVRQTGKNTVRIDIVARNEIPIGGRSVDYFAQKIAAYAKECGK